MIKKICLVSHVLLLIWLFLAMVGVTINGWTLVTQSYKEDWVFFLIYFLLFLLFVVKENIGKHLLTIWLIMWFITQFMFHWYFTIFGPSESKINYFAETIKIIPSTHVYIPDLYHIILHLLIIVTLINMFFYNKHQKSRA